MKILLGSFRLAVGLGLTLAVWVLAAAWLERPEVGAGAHHGWDAIVVLGCRVHDDGRPSIALRRRVERGVALFNAGSAPRLVLTGGVGEGKPISEARAAARIARDLGVPASAIVIEEESRSTEENAAFSRRAIGDGRVLIVSDTYHVARGERVFSRYFAEVGTSGVSGAPIAGAMREVFAIAAYALLGRLDDPHAPPVQERVARHALAARGDGLSPRRGRASPRA